LRNSANLLDPPGFVHYVDALVERHFTDGQSVPVAQPTMQVPAELQTPYLQLFVVGLHVPHIPVVKQERPWGVQSVYTVHGTELLHVPLTQYCKPVDGQSVSTVHVPHNPLLKHVLLNVSHCVSVH
jgi:hypothetical protein